MDFIIYVLLGVLTAIAYRLKHGKTTLQTLLIVTFVWPIVVLLVISEFFSSTKV